MRYLKCLAAALAIIAAFSCKNGGNTSQSNDFQTVAVTLHNPIIPGFHPDPSCVAVGGDFYLVNSTFHYFPGVPVYHSTDLQNWEQIGNVLDRPSQLPLAEPSSWLGIYAPTIRYHDGTFYMITTNVGNGGNFMVTATDPAGPWSEPIWLEQQGIDPSLLFEDGKCYMVSNPDATITLCEIDPVTGATLSPSKPLWKGTGGRFPEGPHIYHKDGWYYLLISEGGIEMAHCLTVARSRDIYGPYESSPRNPIFTHCSLKGQESNIQATGHGDIFQSPDGRWWITMLAFRRYGGDYHHIGRETFLCPVTWEDGWPVINGGEPLAETMTVEMGWTPAAPVSRDRQYGWDSIGPEWMHIQSPVEENYSVSGGKLVLRGSGKGLGFDSQHPTALLRRQQSAEAFFESKVRVAANSEGGIAIYQIFNGYAEFFLRRGLLRTQAVVRYQVKGLQHEDTVVDIFGSDATLGIIAHGDHYEFLLNGREIARLDTALLSSEVVGGFTGVTVGPYCIEGTASFDYFTYQER